MQTKARRSWVVVLGCSSRKAALAHGGSSVRFEPPSVASPTLSLEEREGVNTVGLWSTAYDSLTAAERELRFEHMPVEQKLEVAKIQALLAIGQELSLIHHQGINPKYEP